MQKDTELLNLPAEEMVGRIGATSALPKAVLIHQCLCAVLRVNLLHDRCPCQVACLSWAGSGLWQYKSTKDHQRSALLIGDFFFLTPQKLYAFNKTCSNCKFIVCGFCFIPSYMCYVYNRECGYQVLRFAFWIKILLSNYL